MSGEKTEAPTPKKLRDAAQKGDVWQSRELGHAAALAALALWLAVAGATLIDACLALIAEGLTFDRSDIEAGLDGWSLGRGAASLVVPFALLLALTLAPAVGGPILLRSATPRWSALTPKAQRISPLAGVKRMFGAQGLIELVKALAKVMFLGGAAGWVIVEAQAEIAAAALADPAAALAALGPLVVRLVLVLAVVLALIALIDVPVAFVRRMARLRMSKEELRNEHKDAEGSPELKSAIRQRQHAVLSRSARAAVREANVVLVNPAHFAVALRYRPGVDAVPVVVARGCDGMAAAIRELAQRVDVPILPHPVLTRAVYFTSKVGEAIDERLYLAVATVLAFLHRVDAQQEQAGAARLSAIAAGVAVPQALQFDGNGKPL